MHVNGVQNVADQGAPHHLPGCVKGVAVGFGVQVRMDDGVCGTDAPEEVRPNILEEGRGEDGLGGVLHGPLCDA